MRNTNTKPWWKDYDRRIELMGRIEAQAEVERPGELEDVIVWLFVDFDTRRDYCVAAPEDIGGEDVDDFARDDLVQNALRRYWDILAPSVRIIVLDANERLQAVSPDPNELIGFHEGLNNFTSLFPWPRFEQVTTLNHLTTVCRSQLAEVDRLAKIVDLMVDTSDNGERVVAKWFLTSDLHTQAWREVQVLNLIPPHPHIVSIHRIIVDDRWERVVGWASKYVDGTDLEVDQSHFKMKWLRQLTDTFDYLHLELGIVHGDLQLKNWLVEKASEKLLLVDFEYAEPINEKELQEEFNQLVWSIYEIVTHDSALVEERLYDDDKPRDTSTDIIEEMEEWTVRTSLDCECQALRRYLRDWILRRKALLTTAAKNPINVPERREDPRPSSVIRMVRETQRTRFDELQKKQKSWREGKVSTTAGLMRWERPPYTLAYPDRVKKAIDSSASARTMPPEYDELHDSQGSPHRAEKRMSVDIEEEEPRPKRTKVSEMTVVYGDTVVLHSDT
jgi:serine/threonine protein kinase